MKRIIMIATAALAVWSCTKTEIDNTPDYGSREIVSFTTDGVTRGTPVTDESQLTTMGVFCAHTGSAAWTATTPSGKMFDRKLTRNVSGVWEYDGTPEEWDAANAADRYTFFAYAPYATAANGIVVNGTSATQGTPTLTYTVPADVARQPDLMVAVPRKDIVQTPNPVALQMEHALTCVGFQIAGSVKTEKIKSITIKGVSVTGTLAMDGGAIAWTNLGAKTTTDFTASLNYNAADGYQTEEGTMSTNLIAGNGYLMMIPQALTADAKIVITEVTPDGDFEVIVGLNNLTWEAGKRVNYNITLLENGSVTVTPTSLLLPYFGVNHLTDNINVVCRDKYGNDDPTIAWTLTTANDWLTLTLNDDGTAAAQTISGTGSKIVYTMATANPSTTENRTTEITLNGTTDKVVDVTQTKDPDFENIPGGGTLVNTNYPYVGAFWRKSQTGERVINMNVGTNALNTGAWAAKVVWMDARWNDGDILLASGGSEDPNIYTADETANPIGDAEDYQVTVPAGTYGVASGFVDANGFIRFRIGLAPTATYTPTDEYPARYAVVLLSYNDYTSHQKIFLRQGEDADYLMRPTDPGTAAGTWDGSSRPLARKFSPYNLTAIELKNGTMVGGDNITDHPQIPKREDTNGDGFDDTGGGVFVDYPTQVGAIFQNAASTTQNQRRAFHPGNPRGAITDWADGANLTNWTTANIKLHESCPPGWKRMWDGNYVSGVVGETVAGSEIRQSLFASPANGQSFGSGNYLGLCHYADGFQDRRIYGSASAGWYSSEASRIGYVYFNPSNNASLFLPAPTSRAKTTGALNENYEYIYVDARTSYKFTWKAPNSRTIGSYNATTPGKMRCVVDPDYVAP